MNGKGEKTSFDVDCAICGGTRRLAKVPARKGERRIRICDNCDQPAGKK